MARALCLFLLILAGCKTPPIAQATGQSPDAQCGMIKVIDGDTIKVRCGSHTENLRLLGFDTPETYRAQCDAELALGRQATARLRALIRTAEVIEPQLGKRDRYGRILTRLYLDGRDVADVMIGEGLAVPYHGQRRINWCERLRA